MPKPSTTVKGQDIADILMQTRKDGSKVWEPQRSLTPEYMQEILSQNSQMNFVQRLQSPTLWPVQPNSDGTVSTHIMTSGNSGESGSMFPTLVWDPVSQSLVQLTGPEAALHAKQTGERINFQDAGDATFMGEHYKAALRR